MSRLVPIDRGVVPIGGMVRYLDEDAGFTVQHPYYDWCKAFAHDERVRRGLPIPWNWDEVFDAGMCKATPQACIEIMDAPEEREHSLMQLATSFTAAMVQWAKSGFAVVSYEMLKDRREWCQGSPTRPRCPEFSSFAGNWLTKCNRCGCVSVKLALATEKCPLGKWGATK